MEATTDWFYRRGGAFRDGLRATERLLEVGMKPRWQLFLSKRLIPELPEFLKMAERLRLRERVEELGGEFDLFMHTPSPDGEARHIEALRPTIEDISLLPAEIIESTRKHFADPEFRWIPENEIVVQIVSDQETFPYAYTPPERLWFLVRANGDVFSNHGAQDDWSRLGNLQKDTVADLFARFQNNTPLGLHTIYTMSPRELTKRFGDPASKKVHDTKDDLFMLYVGKYCQAALSHHV
jgi:MoaA/NifB/PqqE/SkfB family radical SAM enzyme